MTTNEYGFASLYQAKVGGFLLLTGRYTKYTKGVLLEIVKVGKNTIDVKHTGVESVDRYSMVTGRRHGAAYSTARVNYIADMDAYKAACEAARAEEASARAKDDFRSKLMGLLGSRDGLTDELMAGLQAALDAEAARVAALQQLPSPEACTAIELGLANIG